MVDASVATVEIRPMISGSSVSLTGKDGLEAFGKEKFGGNLTSRSEGIWR
jgi:hypothetical protein